MGPDARIVITILLCLFALATGGFGIMFVSTALKLGASPSQALTWGPAPALLMLSLVSAIGLFFVLRSNGGERD